jgi:arylsulfatase A-like enzyme
VLASLFVPVARPRALLFLLWVSTACAPPPEPPKPKPNVLLVTIETLRADHVGHHGYRRVTTPNLDRLAREGSSFRNAIAQAPFTLPSVASILTGRTPPGHGVRNHPAVLSESIETLAERFRAAGYQTAAMTRHTWLRPRSGLAQGFDEYHNNKFSAGLDARSLSLAASDWVAARDPSRPFFLWLHFLDPHLPYTPGYPYSVLFHDAFKEESQPKHLRAMAEAALDRADYVPTPYADLAGGPYYDLVLRHYPKNRILLDLAFWRRSRGSIFFNKGDYSRYEISQMVDLYDGAILYTDDNLGRVLQTVEQLGLTGSTLVAVTGDHGEAFGEHGLSFTHDFTLYDEVLRVPLVVRGPGVRAKNAIEQQVRLMDIAPTLLELAGVEGFSAIEARSLGPLLRGGTLPYVEAFAESAPARPQFPEQDRIYLSGIRGKWRMVRNDRWKLIQIPREGGDVYELYNLIDDPGETQNLYPELAGEAAKLEPFLEAWLENDPLRESESSGETGEEELDPAALEQLKALGYVQ